MENEITTLENMNRQLECRGYDFECKFYSTLEEKLLNDKEYEQYISDKNDMIERLNFDLEEIRREIDTKDDIIRKLKRQIEKNEIKTSIFNNQDEDFSDNNISLTPIIKNRNSNTRISKALFNIENLENLNSNNIENNNLNNLNRNSKNKLNNSNNNKSEKAEYENNICNNSNFTINDKNNLNKTNNNFENYENNKSLILNSKQSKIYVEEDIHDLNINAISAKIDDVLNNSLKESPLHFLDKYIINNERNSNTNNNTPNVKESSNNNKLNNSNDENEENYDVSDFKKRLGNQLKHENKDLINLEKCRYGSCNNCLIF